MPPADESTSAIERMLAIKAMPVFADVHPDELALVAEHARVHAFRRGETLYAGTEAPVSSIHLVLDGRVTEYRGGRPFVTHGPHRVLGGTRCAGAHVLRRRRGRGRGHAHARDRA